MQPGRVGGHAAAQQPRRPAAGVHRAVAHRRDGRARRASCRAPAGGAADRPAVDAARARVAERTLPCFVACTAARLRPSTVTRATPSAPVVNERPPAVTVAPLAALASVRGVELPSKVAAISHDAARRRPGPAERSCGTDGDPQRRRRGRSRVEAARRRTARRRRSAPAASHAPVCGGPVVDARTPSSGSGRRPGVSPLMVWSRSSSTDATSVPAQSPLGRAFERAPGAGRGAVRGRGRRPSRTDAGLGRHGRARHERVGRRPRRAR